MVTLSNGHTFGYTTASGTLGYDATGWLHEKPLIKYGIIDPTLHVNFTKSLTRFEVKGNLSWWHPWTCIRPVWEGLRLVGFNNAVGLTNKGIGWWEDQKAPLLEQDSPTRIVVSIYGIPEALEYMAGLLHIYRRFLVAYEINASCPCAQSKDPSNAFDVIQGVVNAKKAAPELPCILKLSANQDIETIVRGVKGMVEAFTINSVPWPLIFPERPNPLAHLGESGVSGRSVREINGSVIERIAAITTTPVIGNVWDWKDIAYVRARGASAISFGSVMIPYPHRAKQYILRDQHRAVSLL